MNTHEPVAIGGAIQAVIIATIGLALGFGWVAWTPDQVGQILGLYAALQVLVTVVQRSKVTPVV